MAVAEVQAPKKSDLGVRTLTALVMVAVAGLALWLGGFWWAAFVVAVALGVLWEFRSLAVAFVPGAVARGLWNAGGIIYVGVAAFVLIGLRAGEVGHWSVLAVLAIVVGTDVGAYFAGRMIGGPKIAPAISPSKTWSGLIGGMIGAGIMALVATAGRHHEIQSMVDAGMCRGAFVPDYCVEGRFYAQQLQSAAWIGPVLAIVAQAGDFFESWMKRRAGVKDSGKLLPGHGGLFDRIDGLLAVVFVVGLVSFLRSVKGF